MMFSSQMATSKEIVVSNKCRCNELFIANVSKLCEKKTWLFQARAYLRDTRILDLWNYSRQCLPFWGFGICYLRNVVGWETQTTYLPSGINIANYRTWCRNLEKYRGHVRILDILRMVSPLYKTCRRFQVDRLDD